MATLTTIYQLDKPAVGGDADLWGGLLNGDLDDLDIFIARPRLKKNTPTVGPTTTLDLALAMFFEFTVTEVTTIAVTNTPATLPDTTVPYIRIVLKITGGGTFAVTWPASFVWEGGSAPVLSGTGVVDVIEAVSYDAGTTWYARVFLSGLATSAPRVSVYHSVDQVVSGNGVVLFDSERHDVGAMHDNVTNNSRLTVPAGQGGLYRIAFHLLVATTGQSAPVARIRKNGATVLREITIMGPAQIANAPTVGSFEEVLAAGDYVELQDAPSGGTTTFRGTQSKIGFELTRIR